MTTKRPIQKKNMPFIGFESEVIEAVDEELEEAFSLYMGKVYKIAERYRCSHLIPFCVKHDMRFVSGNGSWYLGNDKDQLSFDSDWPDDEEWQLLLKILNSKIEGVTWGYLGECMNGVDPRE